MCVYKLLNALIPLLKAGLTLENAFEHLLTQEKFAQASKTILCLLRAGHSFYITSCVMGFPKPLTRLIQIGEQTGKLDKSLSDALAQHAFKHQLKKIIQDTLRYPICVMLLTMATLLILKHTMMPNFQKLFMSSHKAIPLLSRCVFDHFYLGFVVIIIVLCLVALAFKPVFILKKHLEFCSNFHLKLSAGMSVLNTAPKTFNPFLNQGYPLSIVLKIEQYPNIMIQMIQTGEATGELDLAFKRATTYYHQTLHAHCEKLKNTLPGILILFLALLVGLVVVAMYLPILTALDVSY